MKCMFEHYDVTPPSAARKVRKFEIAGLLGFHCISNLWATGYAGGALLFYHLCFWGSELGPELRKFG